MILVVLAAVFFAIVLALLLFGGRSRPPAGDDAETLYVIPSSLRLRSAPSLEAPVLTNLTRGETLTHLETDGSWVKVRRAGGAEGWAERSYLETATDHERRMARSNAIKALPPLLGEVERAVPIYAGPGIFFPIIGELAAGSAVTVYTRNHDFYAVDSQGEVAYAEVDAIDLSEAGAALFEVAASPESDVIDREPDLTASLPEFQPPDFPRPVEREPEPVEPSPAPRPTEPRRSGGVYQSVPPGGTEPVVIDRVVPRYPPAAVSRRIEGTVVVRALVRRNGRVSSVEILRDQPFGLGEAAASAVRRWRFRPGTYQGEPIDVAYNVTVNFRLAD